MRKLVGLPSSQWLVDVSSFSEFARGEVRPFGRLLTHVRPEALLVLITATMRVFEVLTVISIRTPRRILLQAIDHWLRNRRFICRHVGGNGGIRHVQQHEIYQVD